jgi:hypothetical protein
MTKPTKIFWRQKLVHTYNFGAKKPRWDLTEKNYLIFVKRAVFVSRLFLLLKGNNDKTDEDILAPKVSTYDFGAKKPRCDLTEKIT